jgi:hypothetical protein
VMAPITWTNRLRRLQMDPPAKPNWLAGASTPGVILHVIARVRGPQARLPMFAECRFSAGCQFPSSRLLGQVAEMFLNSTAFFAIYPGH